MPANISAPTVPRLVILYDGLCGLCIQSIKVLRRLDWQRKLEYTDLQAWAEVHARYPQLEYDALVGAIHVIMPDGIVYVGYAGVRQIVKHLPLFAWLYPLMYLPGITWIGPKIYRWVAAHHYQFNRIFGNPTICDGGTCKIPGK